jgi:Zn-finger nucleic acid-binding protein
MKCPKCGSDLKEETHGQVKIDVCPECKGMWFDSGEMELMYHVQRSQGTNFFKGLLDLFPGRGAARK